MAAFLQTGYVMFRTRLACTLRLSAVAWVWLLHISVSAVHAQGRSPVPSSEAAAGASDASPSTALPPTAATAAPPEAPPPPQAAPEQANAAQPTAADRASQAAPFKVTKPWRPKRFQRLYPRRSAVPQRTQQTPAWDRSPSRKRSGLLIGGVTTLVHSYLSTALIGPLGWGLDHSSDCASGDITRGCHQEGLLFIPFVGPLLVTDYPSGAQAFLSGTQILGLVLTLAGVYRYVRSSGAPWRYAASSGSERQTFQVYSAPLQGGAFLGTRLTF